MVEVTVRLRFNRKCLGSVRRRKGKNNTILRMPRSPDGRVMFLPSWWKDSMRKAAQVANRHQTLVNKINWDPCIEGVPDGTYKRKAKPPRGVKLKDGEDWFVVHEAFQVGSKIGVNAILPRGITFEEFWQLLDIMGTYYGISPHWKKGEHGTFEVISVQPRRRMALAPEKKENETEQVETKK